MPQVPVNATEFEQVMINILKNAAQAMAGLGYQSRKSISAHIASAMAVVKVSDNGHGMDENTRKRILNHFHNKRSWRRDRFGIVGLSTHHQNPEGMFTVDSTPGKGTCFTISCPHVAETGVTGVISYHNVNPQI